MKVVVTRKAATGARSLQVLSHRDVSEKIATKFTAVDFQNRIITNSMRGTYTTCRRKFWLEYGQRLRQRGTKHYFFVGQAVHKELELMYIHGRFKEVEMQRRINAMCKETLAAAAMTPDKQEKIVHGAAIAMGISSAYARTYLKQDLERIEFVELEKSFGPIPIPGTDWSYAGVRDGAVRWQARDDRYDAKPGDRALMENKTTAQMDANYFARLAVDNQILGYLWSIREEGGPMPTSVLYNVMAKSQLRNKQNESRAQFLDRVVDDYNQRRTRYFYREKVLFSPAMLDVFQQGLVETVREIEWCAKKKNWTMNDKACTAFGMCEFFPLCSSGFKDPTAFLLYERRKKMHSEVATDFEAD